MASLLKKNKLQFLTIACFIFLIVNGTAASVSVGLVPPAPPAPPVPPVPSMLYVDAGGSGNYTTIQAAVGNATSGDTIIVYPGTYTEVVDVNVANLTIRSLSGNPDDTIVRTLSPSHNFKVIANNVTISGFKITGEGYYTGVFITGVSGINIINNKFSGNDCAIQMESSGGCNLSNNMVSDSTSYGFYLRSSSNCILANNTISDTYYEGIYLYNCGSCILTNNTVSDTDEEGIYLDYSSNCNLSGNIILNSGYDSIYLDYSNSCNLTNNIASGSSDDGITLYLSENCNLSGNTISNPYEDGILLYESGSSILTSNNVTNADRSIYLGESENCSLTSNNVSNAYYGIYLYDSDGIVLRNNTANSGVYGLKLRNVENCTLEGNIMSGNRYNFGFSVDNYEINNNTGNIIDTSNLVDGKPIYFLEEEPDPSIGSDAGAIYCINCGDVEIKDFVLQNITNGISLYNTSANLENNTINNTEIGIGLAYSQGVSISDSKVENSNYGIGLHQTANVTIAGNTVRNSIAGVYIYDSENCTLKNNYIQNSTEEYVYYNSVNSKITEGEENPLVSENFLLTPNLVQSKNYVSGGIISEYSRGLRLENNVVDQASHFGILLSGCQNAMLVKNSVSDIGYIGISTEDSSSVKLLDNTVQNVTGRVQVYDTANSPLVGSPLVSRSRDYGCGIYFDNSWNISLMRNSVRDIELVGIYAEESSGVEFLDNTVQDVTGVTQLYEAGNSLISSPLVGTSSASGCGIYLLDLEDLRLEDNTVKNCYSVWGICLAGSVNETIESNTLQNCQGGLLTLFSENSSVSSCSVTNCSSGGILVINSEEGLGTGYTVSDCTVDGSYLGLVVTGEGTFTGNTLSGNSYGLVLYEVNNSLISDNILVGNSLAGIVFDLDETEIISQIGGLVRSMESPESGNNTIYNNYFSNVNNTLFYSEANNTWNTSKTSGESIVGGPYLGGNYWANPNGTGFSENCTDADRDGIADSSYEIVNGTFDYLPLTEIPSTKHKSSPNYIPSSGGSTGVTGIDSAQKRVVAGSRATFSFNNPVSGILGLSFTSQLYSGNVIARIEVLGDGSSGETPEGEVYQLMNILVGNERFESESNINGASINFRVLKSWVEENNIDVSTITINRFHDEEWNALVTEMTSEDEEYYYFTAETSGFSRYAITGDRLGAVAITPVEGDKTGTVTGDEQTEDVKKSTPGFESVFAVLGVLASVFFAKKRILK